MSPFGASSGERLAMEVSSLGCRDIASPCDLQTAEHFGSVWRTLDISARQCRPCPFRRAFGCSVAPRSGSRIGGKSSSSRWRELPSALLGGHFGGEQEPRRHLVADMIAGQESVRFFGPKTKSFDRGRRSRTDPLESRRAVCRRLHAVIAGYAAHQFGGDQRFDNEIVRRKRARRTTTGQEKIGQE